MESLSWLLSTNLTIVYCSSDLFPNTPNDLCWEKVTVYCRQWISSRQVIKSYLPSLIPLNLTTPRQLLMLLKPTLNQSLRQTTTLWRLHKGDSRLLSEMFARTPPVQLPGSESPRCWSTRSFSGVRCLKRHPQRN